MFFLYTTKDDDKFDAIFLSFFVLNCFLKKYFLSRIFTVLHSLLHLSRRQKNGKILFILCMKFAIKHLKNRHSYVNFKMYYFTPKMHTNKAISMHNPFARLLFILLTKKCIYLFFHQLLLSLHIDLLNFECKCASFIFFNL